MFVFQLLTAYDDGNMFACRLVCSMTVRMRLSRSRSVASTVNIASDSVRRPARSTIKSPDTVRVRLGHGSMNP